MVSCTISVVLLVIMVVQFERRVEVPEDESNVIGLTQESIGIECAIFTDEVLLVHPAVTAYTQNTEGKRSAEIYNEYGGITQNMDGGRPIKYSYHITGMPRGIRIEQAPLTLAQNQALRDADIYSFANGGNSLEIYHLLPGTTYYYQLNLLLSSGNIVGTTGSFTTAASPRILLIDGIKNVRDIGGWKPLRQ